MASGNSDKGEFAQVGLTAGSSVVRCTNGARHLRDVSEDLIPGCYFEY